jgi:hypothetical protein
MSAESRYQPPAAAVADIPAEEPIAGPSNPWFSMWIRPRATVQQIVDTDPNRLIIVLAMLIGVTQVLDRAATSSMGDRLSLGAILATALVIGPFVGLIAVHVCAWVVSVVGKMLGGRAPLANVRAAIAWGNVPALWTALSWIPAIAGLRNEMFMTEPSSIETSVPLLMLFFGASMAQVVGAIWSLVAMCKALGQVQGFSGWKGLANLVLAILVLVAPFVALAVLVAVLR